MPRRIDLPGSANKLTYSTHLKCLIVSYSISELDTSTDPVRRYTRSYIEFVDPDHQQQAIVHDEGRPHTASGEKVSCILEWIPEIRGEKYHCIVIGTARKHQRDKGRVIFLRAPSRSECSTKHVHHFDGPVYSIAPYGESTLMVATGYDIVPLVHKLSSDSKWEPRARYTLLSPAISITVHEPYVYISTARESLVILKASDRKLTLHAHDRVKREGLSHCCCTKDLVLSSSTNGTVSVLSEAGGGGGNDRLMPASLAEVHLPMSVRTLLPPSSSTLAVYGTTLVGSVYRFQILPEKEWRLLRFLQMLCLGDSVICPFTPKRKRRLNNFSLDVGEGKPSRMHVDGDILARLVETGPSHLRDVLALQEEERRFGELFADLFPSSSSDITDNVLVWLKGLLWKGF